MIRKSWVRFHTNYYKNFYWFQALKEEIKEEHSNGEKEYKPHNIPSRMGMKVPTDKEKGGRRTGRQNEGENASPNKQTPHKEDPQNNSFSKELAR